MAGEVIKALHTGISVRDMDEALAWYENVLGFKPVYDQGYVPPLGAHLYFIEHPTGYQIELFKYDDPQPQEDYRWTPNTDLQHCGTKHLAVAVDDVEPFKDKIAKFGGKIAHEVQMGDDHVLFINDPSGTIVELIQQPK